MKQTNTTQANKISRKIGNVEKKIPYIAGLVSTAVLNTKIRGVKNKICDVINKSKNYDAKIKQNKGKYFITADYNKFMSETLIIILWISSEKGECLN